MAHTILYFIETNYLLPVGAIESLGWQSFLAVSHQHKTSSIILRDTSDTFSDNSKYLWIFRAFYGC
jgi:hypothetical protein